MKKFFLFALPVAMLTLTSCGTEKVNEASSLPFLSAEKGKWGMIGNDAQVIFEEEFKDCPTSSHNGLFLVKNGQGLWEIYTATEKPEKVGDEYIQAGDFYTDVAPVVKKNEKISLIDQNGKVVTTLDKAGQKNISGVGNFSYGYAIFQAGDDFGLINTKGEVVVPAKYCFIAPASEDRFVAVESKYAKEESKNKVITILDKKGETVTEISLAKYDEFGTPEQIVDFGYIPVKVMADGEAKWGLLDLNGEEILKPSSKIRQLGKMSGDRFLFNDGESWGIRNIKDKVVLRPKYSNLTWASDNLLWAFENNNGHAELTLIDADGNKLTKDTYIDALPFFGGDYAAVKVSDKAWGFVDEEGNELNQTPDIFTITDKSADSWLQSDFFDMDAIVSELKMTDKSMGEFSLDMTPQRAAETYCEFSNDSIAASPENFRYKKELVYEKETEGTTIKYGICFSSEAGAEYLAVGGEMVYDEGSNEWITKGVSWNTAEPGYIAVSISGGKMLGKQTQLIAHVKAHLKTLGKVVKENNNAIVVSLADGNKGYIAYTNGTSVDICLLAGIGFEEFDISSFVSVHNNTVDNEHAIKQPEVDNSETLENYSEEPVEEYDGEYYEEVGPEGY